MTRARVSMVGFEQRKVAPVSLFVNRKPPAAAFAVPDLATRGKVTRAILVPVFVMTEPGETPTREIFALSHAGRIPGPVVKENVPVAGTSTAVAAGVSARDPRAKSPAVANVAQRVLSVVNDDRLTGHSVRGEAVTSG